MTEQKGPPSHLEISYATYMQIQIDLDCATKMTIRLVRDAPEQLKPNVECLKRMLDHCRQQMQLIGTADNSKKGMPA